MSVGAVATGPSGNALWVLTKALFKRNLTQLSRYPLNTVTLLGLLYGGFVVVFFGLRAVGGERFTAGDSPSAVVIGFLLWFLVQQSYQEFTNLVTQEFAQGTIEQFAMSRTGLAGSMILEYFSNALAYVLMLSILAVPAMATTGRWLRPSPAVIPIVALILVQVAGIGLAVAGLALVFKRVAAPAQALQVGFLALIAAPMDRYPWLAFAPLTAGFRLLRRVLADGEPFFSLPAGELGALALTAVVYFAGGLVLFDRMDSMARDRGLLGQY